MPSIMATSLRWHTHSARTKIAQYNLGAQSNRLPIYFLVFKFSEKVDALMPSKS